jgi:hypothetical protein
MNKSTKFRILSFIAFFSLFIIIWTTLNFTFENLHEAYNAMISVGLTAFLAPRIDKFKTQTGTRRQLKLDFSEKTNFYLKSELKKVCGIKCLSNSLKC